MRSSLIGIFHRCSHTQRFSRNLRRVNILVNPSASQESKRNKLSKKSSKHRKEGGQSSYKFVDRARIRVAAGIGGKGCLSYESKLGSAYKKRPDGGHGGDGGLVIIMADDNEQSLNMQRHHFRADDGGNGGSTQKHGRNGKDLVIRVPCGVVVKRILGFNEEWDYQNDVVREKESQHNNNFHNHQQFGINSSLNHSDDKEAKDNLTIETGTNDEYACEDDHISHEGLDANQYQKAPGVKPRSQRIPEDYDKIVDKGIKSEDGMYHFSKPKGIDNSAFLGMGSGYQNDWISSTEGMNIGEREKVTLADLDKPGSFAIVADGGRGGVGNCAYAKRQYIPHILKKAVKKSTGKFGQTAHLELELKLIADMGLVGFPNAGKSSLLAAMSMAKPEIAPYPFTTLHPLVGCINYRDGFRVHAADVPGLINGAHAGRGRGHEFLRHLERTKALLFIVDAASADGRDPVEDLRILCKELSLYGDGDMMTRPSIVCCNKMDLIPDENERNSILLEVAIAAEDEGIHFSGDVFGISAGVTGEGLTKLSEVIRKTVHLGEAKRVISE